MSKRKNNTTLKIVAGTAMTIFTLFSCFVGTYAWFQARQNANNNSDAFNIDSLTGRFLSMKIFLSNMPENPTTTPTNYSFNTTEYGTITLKDRKSKEVIFTPKDESNAGKPADLLQYSLYNQRRPVMLLVELDKVYTFDATNKYAITATTDKNFIGLFNEGQTGDDYPRLKPTNNPLSSVIKVFSNAYSDLSSVPFTYPIPQETASNVKHFANFSLDDEGEYTCTDDDFDQTINFYESQTSGSVDVRYISIVLDYYDAALSFIYNNYLGYDVLDQDSITYICDWTLSI